MSEPTPPTCDLCDKPADAGALCRGCGDELDLREAIANERHDDWTGYEWGNPA